jgi:DeoR/GlpR family transcriptional regulator of sugar metabolism
MITLSPHDRPRGGTVDPSSLRYRRSAAERREWILRTLRAAGFLSITDITREFGVSHMTVRRDLERLRLTGQVRTVHGGVSLPAAGHREDGSADSTGEARIGACAATLAGEADAIAIDSGRVAHEIARALPEQFHGTVVTNSLPVIQSLVSRHQPLRVVGLGGEVADGCAFVGASTVAAIAAVRVRTLFLTADAIDDRGVYAHSDAEASVKRALLAIADRTVLVAHHESFAESAPLLLGPLERITTLVTDRSPPERMKRALRQAEVHLIVADTDRPPTGGPV